MNLQKKLPEYSILGFRILNSKQSIISAYFLLLFESLVIPYFGSTSVEYVAGLFFVLLLNFSFIILILNSCIKQVKLDFFFLLLVTPLLIYTPKSIMKILFIFTSLFSLYM